MTRCWRLWPSHRRYRTVRHFAKMVASNLVGVSATSQTDTHGVGKFVTALTGGSAGTEAHSATQDRDYRHGYFAAAFDSGFDCRLRIHGRDRTPFLGTGLRWFVSPVASRGTESAGPPKCPGDWSGEGGSAAQISNGLRPQDPSCGEVRLTSSRDETVARPVLRQPVGLHSGVVKVSAVSIDVTAGEWIGPCPRFLTVLTLMSMVCYDCTDRHSRGVASLCGGGGLWPGLWCFCGRRTDLCVPEWCWWVHEICWGCCHQSGVPVVIAGAVAVAGVASPAVFAVAFLAVAGVASPVVAGVASLTDLAGGVTIGSSNCDSLGVFPQNWLQRRLSNTGYCKLQVFALMCLT